MVLGQLTVILRFNCAKEQPRRQNREFPRSLRLLDQLGEIGQFGGVDDGHVARCGFEHAVLLEATYRIVARL
jgi:hypothetical protein